jgi:hypothetical protein
VTVRVAVRDRQCLFSDLGLRPSVRYWQNPDLLAARPELVEHLKAEHEHWEREAADTH